MPALKDILKKDINRTIDGVIKADDESRILQEVEEYVLTNEISRQVERIVDSYMVSAENFERGNQPHPLNGVWISGYFGSGKSHLSKIIGHLIQNSQLRDHKGNLCTSINYFTEHILKPSEFDTPEFKKLKSELIKGLELLPKQINAKTIFINTGE